MTSKDKYTLLIVGLVVAGVISIEIKRSIRETPVTDAGVVGEDGYAGISSQTLMERIKRGNDDFMLIDLRAVSEYKEGHIKGAVNIPVADIERHYDSLDREKETILYCTSGPWSRQAYRLLVAKGFKNVKVLANGIVGWKWEVNGSLVTSS